MDAYLEPQHVYRLGCAEFYSADQLFAVETFIIDAANSREALAIARMHAEQSPFFNLRVPDLICIVRLDAREFRT